MEWFEGARKDWKYVLKVSLAFLAFWLLQFLYHFFALSTPLALSLLRASAFSGASLIGIALILGPLAQWSPTHNFVVHRRLFGVWGFLFIAWHMWLAVSFFFGGNPQNIFFDLNPFSNPALFGAFSFWLLLPLFLTSTDWAVQKLGFFKWKSIHRLVYPAYIFAMLHFLTINPLALQNISGWLLLAVTLAAILLQVSAFFRFVIVRKKFGLNFWIGLAIILFGLALFYVAFFAR